MPEPSSPIKVLIVDDEALIRAGLRALLQAADALNAKKNRASFITVFTLLGNTLHVFACGPNV